MIISVEKQQVVKSISVMLLVTRVVTPSSLSTVAVFKECSEPRLKLVGLVIVIWCSVLLLQS